MPESIFYKNSGMLAGKVIVIVHGTLNFGGAERQSVILARYLMQYENAIVEIWGFTGPGELSRLCDREGIPWRIQPFFWGMLNSIKSLTSLAKQLKKRKVDVLLPYTHWPNVACNLIWRIAGAKVCLWNQRNEGHERLPYIYEKIAVLNADVFVSNSKAGADFLTSTYTINKEVNLVNNGIETIIPNSYSEKWCKKLYLDNSTVSACMVANITAKKDHKTLIFAWRKVVNEMDRKGKKAVLVLAGVQYDNHHLADLTIKLGLEKNVYFVDFVKDIPGLLSIMDLGIFSSISEGCPNGLLECMSSGLAIAATDIPAIRAVLSEANLPFLSPIGDSDRLSNNIIQLFCDKELCDKIGEFNSLRIQNEFSPYKMCTSMTTLISEGFQRSLNS